MIATSCRPPLLPSWHTVVETLAPDRTDQAFAIRILPGGARCDHDFLDAHVGDPFMEALAADSVTITNQESRHFVEWKSFDDLLRGPLRRRMSGDVEVNNMSSIMTKHDEREKYAKSRRGNSEEVDGQNVLDVECGQ
mgnify:CR=1 FL=1